MSDDDGAFVPPSRGGRSQLTALFSGFVPCHCLKPLCVPNRSFAAAVAAAAMTIATCCPTGDALGDTRLGWGCIVEHPMHLRVLLLPRLCPVQLL